MQGPVRAVLFDADGVVQENPPGWLDELRGFVGGDRGAAFADDMFATERAAMTGDRDFPGVVREVATRWGCADRFEELLDLWRRVEVLEPVLGLVGELRARGVPCHLASNQNAFRAAFMSEDLGYREVFDTTHFSCEIGVLKSSGSFFEHVLRRLARSASEVAFVDDSEEYVDTARRVGLPAITWSSGDGLPELRRSLAEIGVPTG